MTAATAVKCPTGCVLDHDVVAPCLHSFTPEKVIDTQTGVTLLVAGWIDVDKGTSGVYLYDGEVSPAAAREYAAAIVRVAAQVEAALREF